MLNGSPGARVAALGAALSSLLLIAGCDDSSKKQASPPSQQPVAAAATVRTATCQDWRAAPTSERRALVVGMRTFFGAQVDSPGARGQVMPDQQAYALFESYCKQSYASAFELYRIYGNAAAFTVPS